METKCQSNINNNGNIRNQVMVQPPGVGRRRRSLEVEWRIFISRASDSAEKSQAEREAAASALSLLQLWVIVSTSSSPCSQRFICQANRLAQGPHSKLFMEVGR
jgi:hypothetical protein